MTKGLSLFPLFWGLAAAALAQPDEIPGAQPGKCYAKCFMPDKYEVVSDQVMVRAESSESVAVPAQFETIQAPVPVKEAYTRLVVEPAEWETVTEKIQVAASSRRLPPSNWDTVQETVLVKPAAKQYQLTEAVFETVNTPVVTEEAYMVYEVLPQQYEQVLDQVEIKPATTRWVRKKADRDCLGAEPDDCFVWCLVEEPAQYEAIYKQVSKGCDGKGSDDCVRTTPVPAKTTTMPVQKVKTPARAIESMSAAEYKTIVKWVPKSGTPAPDAGDVPEFVTVTRQVLKKAASVREVSVPAETKPITRKVVKTPAELRQEPVPAEFTPVLKRKLVRKGGFTQWREIICGEKISGYTATQLQEALKALGYFKGAPEATLGPRTKAALVQFQQERGLPADGNVDFETLHALGIRY